VFRAREGFCRRPSNHLSLVPLQTNDITNMPSTGQVLSLPNALNEAWDVAGVSNNVTKKRKAQEWIKTVQDLVSRARSRLLACDSIGASETHGLSSGRVSWPLSLLIFEDPKRIGCGRFALVPPSLTQLSFGCQLADEEVYRPQGSRRRSLSQRRRGTPVLLDLFFCLSTFRSSPAFVSPLPLILFRSRK
jgi:hypothetical protein